MLTLGLVSFKTEASLVMITFFVLSAGSTTLVSWTNFIGTLRTGASVSMGIGAGLVSNSWSSCDTPRKAINKTKMGPYSSLAIGCTSASRVPHTCSRYPPRPQNASRLAAHFRPLPAPTPSIPRSRPSTTQLWASIAAAMPAMMSCMPKLKAASFL